jgi:superfamily I DNA and/or RNA helicase
MDNISKIFDYFIDFEVRERLSKIEINKENSMNITKDELINIEVILAKIHDKKQEQINKVVRKIKFKNNLYSDKVIYNLKLIIERNKIISYEELVELIDKKEFEYSDVYEIKISDIKDILNDNSLLIMTPIIVTENGKKRIPLITFQCKLIENGYEIEEYKIQQEALELLLASIFDCHSKEAEYVMGRDFNPFIRSLSSMNIGNDIFRLVSILDEQLKIKFNEYGFKSIYDIKDYKKLAVADQLVISMDTIAKDQDAIFTNEIKLLKERLQDGNTPELIKKYIYGNSAKKDVNGLKIINHFGSYKGDYPINYKQAKVVSSYLSNSFIAVSGPPGTGKTTVLKEIIADNFVRKIKEVIEKWDEPWEEIGYNNRKVYASPLGGLCKYSIIVASTNNAAVDNIGIELMKEIKYFSEIAESYKEELKGIFCARLGKSDNIKDFVFNVLNKFIDFLDNEASGDNEIDAEKYIEAFNKKWNSLSNAYTVIDDYLSARDKFLSEIKNEGIINGELNKKEILKAEERLENNIKDSEEIINKLEIDCSKKEVKRREYSEEILNANKELENYQNEASSLGRILEEYRKKNKVPVIKFFNKIIFKIKHGDIENIELKFSNINKNIKHINKNIEYVEESYERLIEEIKNKKQEVVLINSDIDLLQKQISLLKSFQQLEMNFNQIKELHKLQCEWDDDAYSFLKAFTIKRKELFELALNVNKAFIIKNKDKIKHNLSKVYANGNWFSPFYKETFCYNEGYIQGIKSIWETLFICFPVVTTTLHSFSKNTFHMVEGIFDTIMIDEAGQVLPHYVVAPLYRARRTIIVGDTLQLEPIYNNKIKNVIEGYEFSSELEEIIDIQKSSVQYCADSASDIFEKIGNEQKGIMLEEHRRCEESIMAFSNKYLYKKKLNLLVKDTKHEFLGSSLCFIDTRGIKLRNNTNLLEVTICKRIVEWFVQKYGCEYKKKIAIITPFRNQKELLKENIQGVEIGTVNTFQGQEKEIILLSSVIQDRTMNSFKYSTGIEFLGDKPNFLNVAFSRAKEQLIIVGNYNAYEESGNYLKDAIKSVKNHGRIYSIYNMDLMKEELENDFWEQLKNLFYVGNFIPDNHYDNLFKENLEQGLLVGEKHHDFLINSMKLSEKSIHVVSPWITSAVVNDEMIKLINEKLELESSINICFGYNKSSYTLPDNIDEIVKKDSIYGGEEKNSNIIKELYKLINNNLKYKPPMHTKALIIDRKFMVIGSHNWLSKVGKRKGSRDEISCIVSDENMIEYVIGRYF